MSRQEAVACVNLKISQNRQSRMKLRVLCSHCRLMAIAIDDLFVCFRSHCSAVCQRLWPPCDRHAFALFLLVIDRFFQRNGRQNGNDLTNTRHQTPPPITYPCSTQNHTTPTHYSTPTCKANDTNFGLE